MARTTLRNVLERYVEDHEQALGCLEKLRPALLEIPVEWNGRLKRTAGRAIFNRMHGLAPWEPKRVELSPVLQAKPRDLRHVVLHEAGHLLAGRNAGHGRRWELACILLGLQNPTRVSNLQSVADTRKLVSYCAECERGHWGFKYYPRNRRYTCSRCGEVVATDPAVLRQVQRESK